MRFLALVGIAAFAFLPITEAQDLELHGFAQANYSARFAGTGGVPGHMAAKETDLILGDERVQLELSHYSDAGNASFSGKIDLLRDALDNTMKLDVREAYLDLSLARLDLRIGRQVMTWGLGDLVFINDTFPKDWVAFLLGQPLQYLKVASDAVSLSLSTDPLSAQFVVMPLFQSDTLPSGERLAFYDPLPPMRQTETPAAQFGNVEVAGRFYRTLVGFDASLYAYRGFSRMPAIAELTADGVEAMLFYPKLGVYGASLQGALLGGLLSLEGGYYDAIDDRDGTNPFVENPQVRTLLGYQRAIGSDLTVGLQYYLEAMLKHDAYEQSLPPGFPPNEQQRHNITLRITQFLKYQTLRLSLFAWVSPNEEDYFINPEVRYSFTDELWGALGVNLLGGSENYTFLGQFDANDNVYFTARYGF